MKLALALALFAASAQAAPAPYGILLLAHGGDGAWNAEVSNLRGRVNRQVPAETAIGMADLASLQAAVDRLEKRGVSKIVAVPLFIQSRSEVLDQTRYALGLAEKPSAVLQSAYERMAAVHAHHGGGAAGHAMEFSTARVKAKAPISMAPALDDHALVGRILNERAKALAGESVRAHLVLVAHGPVDDAAVPVWEASLRSLCAQAGAGGSFADCGFGLLRDDSAPGIRAAAVAALRDKVARKGAAKGGVVVVVPVLIARGGIEEKIVKDLAGLDYRWDGKTLMPHEGFDGWVLESASKAEGTPK